MQFPAGQYGCILADPPWGFRTFSGSNVTPHRTEEDHYPTMTLADMQALPVASIAAKNCALFMWTIGSHVPQALALADAWGFAYKTDAFYWLKTRLIDADQIDLFTGDVPPPGMGMGYWSRKQVETCYLFTRGKPKVLSRSVRQLIIEARREHSRKPNAQYERIEALIGGPRLEMFSRTNRDGWSNWGLDAGKFGDAA